MKFYKNLFALFLLIVFISTIIACDIVDKTSTTNTTTDNTTLSVENDESIVKVDQELVISYETNDVNGVTFTSNNESVATVDAFGKVKGVSIGIVTIVITSNSNSNVKEEVTITVIKSDPSYFIIKGFDYVEVGKPLLLTASPRPDATNPDVIWSTNNESVATIDQSGKVTGVSVGRVKIFATAKYNSSIKGEVSINVIKPIPTVITILGIETPVLTGDQLNLDSTIKPSSREGTIIWSTSDDNIATITEDGVLTAVGEGTVTVTAKLANDETASKSETFIIYDEIDSNNILDVLMIEQRLNLDFYEFTAFGATTYEYSTFRSVSNFYFDDLDITQKFIPVGSYNRPGKMSALPSGVTPYNDENIYWVVIHDTGNSTPGATALMHSNYVINPSTQTSWHYTVDDNDIYQHLPDEERGYHAGDGSNLVGQGSYAGGGNRNGIGIEMAINEGSDIFETWQRSAKLAAQLLVKYNLPLDNLKYHIDFSGKICPRTLITADLQSVFEQMVAIEYEIAKNFGDAEITMRSLDPEYLDDNGRIIQFPSQPMVVSYEVSVTKDGVTQTKTFDSYITPSNN
jgi:N-acetylmuramoyl-L-alanine amidase